MRKLLAQDGGFGLVELVIAMAVMAVGIGAVVAGFSSGIVSLNRASRIGNAGTLADKQMEQYRALAYTSIALSANGTGTTYTTDSAYPTSAPAITACSSGCTLGTTSTEYAYCTTLAPSAFPAPCTAIQSNVAGPDGRSYRVDTFMSWYCGAGTLTTTGSYTSASPGCLTVGTAVARPVKQVTVVVRDGSTGNTYVRETSTFDQST